MPAEENNNKERKLSYKAKMAIISIVLYVLAPFIVWIFLKYISNYYFLILLLMTVAYIVAILYTVIAIFNKTSKDDYLGKILTIIAALTPFIELIVCILGGISLIRLM